MFNKGTWRKCSFYMAGREYELYLQKEDVKQEIRRELKIKEGEILSYLGS